jgi:hypothetical protein
MSVSRHDLWYYGRERALKERVAHWREALGAAAV